MPLSLTISLCAILIALIALLFTVRNYDRKTGVSIRGDYTIKSSRACEDAFVSSIVLENMKDKSVTIFAIYLQMGHNDFVEIENHENKPLIIKAFETYKKDFGPLEFYTHSLIRSNINSLLLDIRGKKRLILSTSHGKYVVPRLINKWTPRNDYFSNYLTSIIKPFRSVIGDHAIGSNVRYVVKFVSANNEEEIVQIQDEDYKLVTFRNFSLSKKDLESKSALEALLERQRSLGNLKYKTIEIIDMVQFREQNHGIILNHTVRATSIGFFKYYIIGKLETIIVNWKQKYLAMRK